ncbi:MAG: LysE family translocator, partial [Chloroflexota bacterium]
IVQFSKLIGTIMDISFFLRSILIGFTLAAAVGPIWMLVMQRTLTRGWRAGLASGLGVALADSMFGLAGGLGFSVLASSFGDSLNLLRILGAVVLVYLGIRIMTARNVLTDNGKAPDTIKTNNGLLSDFGSMLLLTFANPLTVLSFAALYTSIGAESLGLGHNTAWYFAASIFVGSGLWWLVLVAGISILQRRLNPAVFLWVNRVSGAVIFGLGLQSLIV